MKKTKLFVFCIDALCSSDLDFMRTLPHFAEIFKDGAVINHVEPSYPSMTYPGHTTILTGVNPARHGIYHNEHIERGKLNQPWFCMKSDIKVPTLMDVAKEAGLTTCSINWPVSGGANIDYNMPMIVPVYYKGYEPQKYLRGTASDNVMDEYFWKFGRYHMGVDRSLDLLAMALAPEIIKDHGQPDVMLVKMCDLDGARHMNGVYSEAAKEQLRKHNEELGVLLESIRRYGDYDNTNFVVLGDHGHSTVEDVLKMNVLLKKNGFLQVNPDGTIKSFDALCHSTGFSAFIELRDPNDKELYKRVYDFLLSLKDDERIKLDYVFTAKEALEQYGLSGPFEFVIESSRGVTFSEALLGDELFGATVRGDHKIGEGSHGGLPFKTETTTFIAKGPSVKPGALIERRQMIDEAPTMARMLGLEMKDVEGKVITEILK